MNANSSIWAAAAIAVMALSSPASALEPLPQERYINDRFLPDKAIDLLDEAAACASLRDPVLQ